MSELSGGYSSLQWRRAVDLNVLNPSLKVAQHLLTYTDLTEVNLILIDH